MSVHGEKIIDIMIVEKIIRSMSPKFDYVVCTIEKSSDIYSFTLDELQSFLLMHEQKMNCS